MRFLVIISASLALLTGCGEAEQSSAAGQAQVTPAAAPWFVEFAPAAAEATRTGKPILADVQGSDFCISCKELHEQVFNTPEFTAWAAKSVVLFNVDLPLADIQPPAIKQANEAWAKKWFPTEKSLELPALVVIDARGDVLSKVALTMPFKTSDVIAAIEAAIPRR